MVTRGPGITVAFRSRTLGARARSRRAEPWAVERRYLRKNLGAIAGGTRVVPPRVIAPNVWLL